MTWNAPTGAVDGLLFEMKVGEGAFQAMNSRSNLVPASWTGMDATLGPSSPDGTDYVVRAQSVRRGATSAYSNEATYHRPLNAPAGLTGSYDWNGMGLALSWSRHSTAATGVVLTRYAADASGMPTGEGTPLTVPGPSPTSFLDTQAPRNGWYVYELANTHAGETSGRIRSGALYAGMVAPVPTRCEYDAALESVRLQWTPQTSQADSVRVERQQLDASGNPLEAWGTVATLPGTATGYLDGALAELATYQYRVTNLHGTSASTPVGFGAHPATGLRAPGGFTASLQADGLHLAWANRSTLASGVQLVRSAGTDPALFLVNTLAAPAASWILPRPSPGDYVFRAQAVGGYLNYPSTFSSPAQVQVTVPGTPGAMAFRSQAAALAGVTDAGILPDGTWGLATADSVCLVPAHGGAWPAHTTPSLVAGTPTFFQVDGQGHPHAVYATPDPQGGSQVLAHAWHDGSAWQVETLYRGEIGAYGNSFRVALGRDGVPQATLLKIATFTLAHLRKVAGAWTEEALPGEGFTGDFQLCLDAQDGPHVLLSQSEVSRTGAGTWTSTNLMANVQGSLDWWVRDGRWIDADHAVVVCRQFDADNQEVTGVLEKVAGVWQPMTVLTRDDRYYPEVTDLALVQSADHARIAVVQGARAGLRVFHRTDAGWQVGLVGPALAGHWIRGGFDGSNRLHILAGPVTGGSHLEYLQQ